MSISYQCLMIQALGPDIANGAQIVTPSASLQEVHIEWLTAARPRAIFAQGPASYQAMAPRLASLFTHDETENKITVLRPQTFDRAALIRVTGADGLYARRAWLTKAIWQYDWVVTEPIQFQFAPAAAIVRAAPVPFVGDDGYVGLCAILKSSDYRGDNRIDIAGFGSVVVVGLWDVPEGGSEYYSGPTPPYLLPPPP